MLSIKRLSALSPGLKAQLPILAEISVLQKRNATSYGHQMKYGQGGRNSFNGNIVTVFGGTGFLGRYVINRLAKAGTQVIVPYRGSEDDVRDIRVMGDLGQIVFFEYDIRDYDSIMKTVSHSNCVVNLVGKNQTTRNFTMQYCNVDGAQSLAKAATESNVRQFIHMSHLCAKEDSPSAFMQTKAQSEKVVLEAFPKATIMRSAQIYGDEDRYLNKFAYLRVAPFIPLIDGGLNTKRPVFIPDVAQAIVTAALDAESHAGKIYELYGPEEYYLYDMIDFVFRLIRRNMRPLNVPLWWYKMLGWIGEQSIWDHKLSRDMIIREMLSEEASDVAFTFGDLGINPTNLNDAALPILRRHRKFLNFELNLRDEDVIKPVNAFK